MAQPARQTNEEPAKITPYAMVGGEAGLRQIVARFYEIMDTDPAAARIRGMHAKSLAPVQEKLFEFMSGWLGGPALYQKNPNNKCIVSAHSRFDIDAEARDQWLMCMRQALEDVGLPKEVRDYLDEPLFKTADFFRNR
jgi:hemoglobin